MNHCTELRTYLHNADGLDRHMTFYWLGDRGEGLGQRHRGWGGRGGALAGLFLFLLPVGSVKVAGQLEQCNIRVGSAM